MTRLFSMAALVIIVDRLAKYLALGSLIQDRSMEVMPGIFHLTLVLNTGAAFGLFKNFKIFFVISSLLVIALICIYALGCKRRDMFLSASLGLILGGAAGNLIDRIVFGYVIDFIDFRVWPVFNIADSAITIGSCMLVLKFFLGRSCCMK